MTLKTLQIAGLGALLALAATAASASDTANASLTMNTSAPRTCAVTGDVTGTGDAVVTGGAASGSTLPNVSVNFGNALVDPVTALPTFSARGQVIGGGLTASHSVQINIPAYCNYANSNISIRSANGGLRLQGTVAVTGDFASIISTVSEVKRTTGGVSRNTVSQFAHTVAGGTNSGAIASPWNGSLQVILAPLSAMVPGRLGGTLQAAPAGTPMLAGTYADTMTVRFGQSL